MGFFLSAGATTKKKKAKSLIDLETFISPTPSNVRNRTSHPTTSSTTGTPLAPPLFASVTDSDRQPLKTWKYDRSSDSPSIRSENGHTCTIALTPSTSTESCKRKKVLMARTSLPSSSSSCRSNSSNSKRRVISTFGLSPASHKRNLLPPSLPLTENNVDEQETEKSKVPCRDTSKAIDSSKDCIDKSTTNNNNNSTDHTSVSTPPISPTNSSHISTANKNNNDAANIVFQDFQSSLTLKQSSPTKVQQRPSLLLGDSCSYIEEYIIEDDGDTTMDDSQYYYEEIIVEDDDNNDNKIVSSSSTTNDANNSNKQKLVHFDEYDEIQNTIHLNDYSEIELKKTYFKRQDYDTMIQQAKEIISKYERRCQQQNEIVNIDNVETAAAAAAATTTTTTKTSHRQSYMKSSNNKSELEIRGLEAWSTTGLQEIRTRKEMAIETVWEEQYRQWKLGIVDLEKLRQVYQEKTIESKLIAQERAIVDQQIVQKIQQLDELKQASDKKQKKREKQQQQQHRPSMFMKGRKLLNKSIKAAAGKIKGVNKKNKGNQNDDDPISYTRPSLCSRSIQLETSISVAASASIKDTTNTTKDSEFVNGKAAAAEVIDDDIGSVITSHNDDDNYHNNSNNNISNASNRLKQRQHKKEKQSGIATWEMKLVADGKL